MNWRGLPREVGECLFLPALAASLPWDIAWPLLRRSARCRGLFAEATARAQAMAVRENFAQDPDAWARGHRLTRIVDQVDPAISSLRSDRWMRDHLQVEGDALPAGACIFAGFHYGPGFWSLRWLRSQGHPVSFLSRPIVAEEFAGQPLRFAFERWRMRQAGRAGGAPIIYVGDSVRRIREALQAGTSVLGMVDVPLPESPHRAAAPFMGGEAWFPDGLVRIARSEGVPLFAYVAGLDPSTGRRSLTLTRLPVGGEDPMHSLAAMLERAIRRDPPAWHLWAEWPLFFRNSPSH